MAAGLGFKTFTTGEVLTAGDVNGYLMQGINVFASSAARAAAITSPQEGQYSFLKDTNALEYYDGAAWVGAPVGDITAVTAGKGLTGGGASGDVTVALATTAKGDLVAGSGASTAAVVTVGSDGAKLFANSTATAGMSWQGSLEAGKNFLINGGMDFWQRGTSFSVAAFNFPYTADRWTTFNANACTISQETTTVPTGANYALKITGGATTSGYEIYQGIESLNALRLAGQQVTASIFATGTTGVTHSITVEYSTSVDPNAATGSWTGISPAGSASVTSGTFSKISTSVAVPSTAKSLRFKISVGSLTSGQSAIFGNAQLELGYLATNFSRAGSTIGGELALCQRYYYRLGAGGGGNTAGVQFGYLLDATASSSTNLYGILDLPVTMRKTPSSVDYLNIGWIAGWGGGVNAISVVAIYDGSAVVGTTPQAAVLQMTTTGATTNNRYALLSNNSTAAYLGINAEL